jgi:hypothetical protein
MAYAVPVLDGAESPVPRLQGQRGDQGLVPLPVREGETGISTSFDIRSLAESEPDGSVRPCEVDTVCVGVRLRPPFKSDSKEIRLNVSEATQGSSPYDVLIARTDNSDDAGQIRSPHSHRGSAAAD